MAFAAGRRSTRVKSEDIPETELPWTCNSTAPVDALDISKKPAYAIDKLKIPSDVFDCFMSNQNSLILVTFFLETELVGAYWRQLLTAYFRL